MCLSCLQCWVSDQDWRIRAYCLLGFPGPWAMNSKSSGNIFWTDALIARGYGLGTTSPGWAKRKKEGRETPVLLFAPPAQDCMGEVQKMVETGEQWA